MGPTVTETHLDFLQIRFGPLGSFVLVGHAELLTHPDFTKMDSLDDLMKDASFKFTRVSGKVANRVFLCYFRNDYKSVNHVSRRAET